MNNLPIENISQFVLKYLDQACPEYSKELDDAIKYNNLNPILHYENSKTPLNGNVAEISEDRQIKIYEPFIAYLWTLCYAITTFNNSRNDSQKIQRVQIAELVFKYGLSLNHIWANWPKDLPNPSMIHEPNVDQANGLTAIAMTYILAHEIGHFQLGHSLILNNITSEEAKQDEYDADKYALDVLTGGYEKGYLSKNNSINIGIIIGLGSILFLENNWSGGVYHPDSDDRLIKIMQHIENKNSGSEEYWIWGLLLLWIWNIEYGKISFIPSDQGAKSDFLSFINQLKKNQLYNFNNNE